MMSSSQAGAPRTGWRRPDPWVLIAVTSVLLVLGFGLLFPISRVFVTAVTGEGVDALVNMVTSPVMRSAIVNTIVLGLCVSVAGVSVAFLFALVQTKFDVPFKRVLHVVAIMPVVSPPFAFATAIIVLFGRNGVISKGIFGVAYDIYGLDGLTLALTLSFFPVVYLTLLGMMQRLDPSLDEAATNLGASRGAVFRTVTLPMLIPGIAGGCLLLFVEAIADLGNPLALGGNFEVLSVKAYLAITGQFDLVAGSVLSLSLFVPALVVFLLQRYWIERRRVYSVTGKPSGAHRLSRGPVAWLCFAGAAFIAALILTIFLTIILGAFTKVPGVNNTFTMANFEYVVSGIGSQAMVQTTMMTLVAAPIAGVMGIVISYLVIRRLKRTAGAFDFVAMLGIAVPGTVLGIGFVLAFRQPLMIGDTVIVPSLAGGQAVLGGMIAIILVLIVRSIPAAVRSGSGALQQLHPSLDEASISLGASSATTFWRVTLPLIRPALIAGLIFAIARSMTTLSPIIFLTTPQTKVMTAQILGEVAAGRFGNAFAYCCVLMAILACLMLAVQFLVRDPMARASSAGSVRAARLFSRRSSVIRKVSK